MRPGSLPLSQIARERGRRVATLQMAALNGRFPAEKLGVQWFAVPAEVDAYLASARPGNPGTIRRKKSPPTP